MIRSSVGAVLAGIYFAVAAFITQDEVRHSAGGWISLRGMLTGIITAPSQFLVAPLLRLIGVPPVNYSELGFSGYTQLVLHVLVSTIIIYFLGAGVQWLVRAAFTRS